jgi:hypothetical protein
MAPGQFTQGAFDGVALMHLLLKGLGALFDPASLQQFVVLAHDQRAILLVGRNALLSQRAALAVALAPLEAVGNFGFAVLANAAATSALVAGGTASAPVSDVNAEVFNRQAGRPRPLRAGRGGTHQAPAFLGRLVEPGRRDVSAVGIKFAGPFQTALGLIFERLIQARLITLGGFLGHDRN